MIVLAKDASTSAFFVNVLGRGLFDLGFLEGNMLSDLRVILFELKLISSFFLGGDVEKTGASGGHHPDLFSILLALGHFDTPALESGFNL